jgi:transcriptional regulator with XRE-family HTH domain
MEEDLLDEMVDIWTQRNPQFPHLLAEVERRHILGRQLAQKRKACGLSQTVIAARMGTAASVVSKLEAGGDVKLSTLARCCAAVGARLAVTLSPLPAVEGRRRAEPERAAPRSSRARG